MAWGIVDSLRHYQPSVQRKADESLELNLPDGVAKAGREEGSDLIGGSAIVAPSGEIVAQARTVGDEVIVAECDLDAAAAYRRDMMDLARHRRPDQYGLLVR